jgi:glycolate oxidase FAD binding subunit
MDRDQTEVLIAAVAQAAADAQAISIVGSGSKSFLLPDVSAGAAGSGGRLLNVAEHLGIIEYRPDELVITARAGTSLKDIRQTLQREDQLLPFEPPAFRDQGTLGGALAAGLSGSSRPWKGSLRDAVLGVRLINGLGELLRFGGSVVKNVAGYDVSRLQAGAFGTLGVLLDISVRVIPAPRMQQTQVLAMSAADALVQMRAWARQSLPISGLCHLDNRLWVRLQGAESAVRSAVAKLGGESSSDADFWSRIDNHQHPFFQSEGTLLRQRVAPAQPLPENWDGLVEWAGAQRWQFQNESASEPTSDWLPFDHRFARAQCQRPGGNMLLGDYQQRLRRAFDPQQLFNPELGHADSAA